MTATRLNTFIERLHQVMNRAGNDEDAIRTEAELLLHDRVSISIHVYGADIGKVKRHVYKPDTAEVVDFISGYAQAATGQDRLDPAGLML